MFGGGGVRLTSHDNHSWLVGLHSLVYSLLNLFATSQAMMSYPEIIQFIHTQLLACFMTLIQGQNSGFCCNHHIPYRGWDFTSVVELNGS